MWGVGDNSRGQLGTGDRRDRPLPVELVQLGATNVM
eukprot:SAG22_NODE_3482_length_1687_cov_1.232997_2_plen_35_part_01